VSILIIPALTSRTDRLVARCCATEGSISVWVIVRDTAEELVYREVGKIVDIYRMEGGDHFL
jgi:ribulose 1,5-bisphosphate carboxylase large subunit-like protein